MSNPLRLSGSGIDTDLYSRQLYVLDLHTMKFITHMHVFISGLRGLGVEIAKNVILAGPKSVTIHDDEPTQLADLSSQFYLTEADVGKPRASSSVKKLSELNPYVTVKVHAGKIDGQLLSQFNVAVFVDKSYDELLDYNIMCHEGKTTVPFIATGTNGLFGYHFVDFGAQFDIVDPNGEQAQSHIVSNITKEGVVTVHDENRLDFETGDSVLFSEVQGMEELNSAGPIEVEVLGPFSFKLKDVSLEVCQPYQSGGLVQKVKLPKTVQFLDFREALQHPEFLISDFSKFDHPGQLHFGFQALSAFRSQHNKLPEPGNKEHADAVVALAKRLNDEAKKTNSKIIHVRKRVFQVDQINEDLIRQLALYSRGDLNPMAAFFGGVVAQEALKVSGKFTPTRQFFYFSAEECLPSTATDAADLQPRGTRYDGQVVVFGHAFQQKLNDLKIFLVGSGALGCEFLKNFAMTGISSGKGLIQVTDMDNIEKSNLNRQFLFRNTDIGHNKAQAATAAAAKMNPQIHVKNHTTPVGPDTEEYFDDEFWDSLDVVCNALDNVQARLYTDSKCVLHKRPLLESGTLGTKANSQVVIPLKTESYASSKDPPEKSLPLCTLKNFPNAIEHTIEWARDLFVGLFKNGADEVNSFLTQEDYLEKLQTNPISNQKESLETIESLLNLSKDLTFDKCVEWARLRFQDLFHNKIAQLLFVFPKDHVVNGTPFWSGPKRAPTPLDFNPADPLHIEFVLAAANLLAFIFKLAPNRDIEYIRKVVSQVKVPPFSPSKGVRIKENENDNTQEGSDDDDKIIEDILKRLPASKTFGEFRMEPAIFEKDDNSNFHVSFITCASNLRARNYQIKEATFFETKKIAGRIIPAIATTTAMITGLVCLELYKVIQKHEIEKFRSSYVNLSLPLFTFSEPVPCYGNKSDPKKKKKAFPEGYTLWDFFEIDIGDVTVEEFSNWFKKTHNLNVQSIAFDKFLVYSSFFPNHATRYRRKISELIVEISKKSFPAKQKYINFLAEVEIPDDEEEISVEMPPIRMKFRN